MNSVHSGKGGKFFQGNGLVIHVDKMFGGTTPVFKNLLQDKQNGLNDLMKAKANLAAYNYNVTKKYTKEILE